MTCGHPPPAVSYPTPFLPLISLLAPLLPTSAHSCPHSRSSVLGAIPSPISYSFPALSYQFLTHFRDFFKSIRISCQKFLRGKNGPNVNPERNQDDPWPGQCFPPRTSWWKIRGRWMSFRYLRHSRTIYPIYQSLLALDGDGPGWCRCIPIVDDIFPLRDGKQDESGENGRRRKLKAENVGPEKPKKGPKLAAHSRPNEINRGTTRCRAAKSNYPRGNQTFATNSMKFLTFPDFLCFSMHFSSTLIFS